MSYILSYWKSDGSRNIICYLTSCSFSCSKIQKWIHLRLWYIALANFCLHFENFNSLIFLATVMASLTLLLTGFCCSHQHFVSHSPWLGPPKCPFSPYRLDVPNSPALNLYCFCVIPFWSLSRTLPWVWMGVVFSLILYHNAMLFFCIVLAKNSILDLCHWQPWPYWWLNMLKTFSKSMKLCSRNTSCRMHYFYIIFICWMDSAEVTSHFALVDSKTNLCK